MAAATRNQLLTTAKELVDGRVMDVAKLERVMLNMTLNTKQPELSSQERDARLIGQTVSRARLLDLQKKQCDIFATTFNPERQRLGNKVLRQRLKGPILAAYYPRKSVTLRDLQDEFKRYNLETYDEDQLYRVEGLQIARLRGKGAPKKKRTADTTKKGKKKR